MTWRIGKVGETRDSGDRAEIGGSGLGGPEFLIREGTECTDGKELKSVRSVQSVVLNCLSPLND